MQRSRQFFASPTDRIDMEARQARHKPIPAVPELGTFDGGVPAPLLLIEPTEEQIHLPMNLLIGMAFRIEAMGALALMDFLLRHRLTLRDRPRDSMPSVPKSVELVRGWPLRGIEDKTLEQTSYIR